MKIGTYNIEGLLGSEHDVVTLMNENALDVLALQETWTRGTETDLLPSWITGAVSAPVPTGALRGFGGVAMVVNPAIRHRVVMSKGTTRYQFVIALVGDMHIASVYISPHAVKAQVLECLNEVKQAAPPPAVIIGDLNARHVDWDTRSNYRGALLKVWARNSDFAICAPDDQTFVNYNGASTVDISLLKQCSVSRIETVSDAPRGNSGHLPVVVHIDKQVSSFQAHPRIAHSRRANEFCNDMAAHFFTRAFPLLTSRFHECSTPEQMDENVRVFCETFECPWSNQGQHPNRYRYFWNRDLEKMARARDKLRTKAQHQDDAATWAAHKSANKQLKREARRQRRQTAQEAFRKTAYDYPDKATSWLATALKNAGNISVTAADKEHSLNPDDFTKFLECRMAEKATVTAERFQVDKNTKDAVKKALLSMKPNRGAGLDGVFVEGLKLVPSESADLICSIWQAVGRINYTPPQLREAEVIPLFKKGHRAHPENYRPIALISHVRKVIDKALDILVRKEYVCHDFQVGFRSRLGTETAILRAIDAIDSGFEHVACLDLKAAYDSVPRRRLMRRLQRVLPANLCRMITHTLQPSSIVTRGSVSSIRGLLHSGVQQGSPLSPMLFNVYIDSLAEDITALSKFNASRAAILYADDVLLFARSRLELQRLLDIATNWANVNGMSWNTKKSYILTRTNDTATLYLAGDLLQCTPEIEYLGVTLTLNGATEASTLNRIRSAQAKWTSALRLEHKVGTMPATTAVTLYKTVIRPLTEYGLQFCKGTFRVIREYEGLEERLFSRVVGPVAVKDKPRARKLLRLQSISERRCVLITKMCARVEANTKARQDSIHPRELQMRQCDYRIMQTWFAKQGRPPQTTADMIHRTWRQLCAHHRRRIPNPRHGPVPALTIRNTAVRTRAIRYYFVQFPCMGSTTVRARLRAMGEDDSLEETMRTFLDKPQLEGHEKAALEHAIVTVMKCEIRRDERTKRQHG